MFASNNLKKITAIITAILGLIVIVLGLTLLGEQDIHTTSHQSFGHTAIAYDVPGASFGADFYTYMYDASDIMVSELGSINQAASTIIDAQNAIIKNTSSAVQATDNLISTISKASGIITISIGIAILAYALQCAGKAFALPETAPITTSAPSQEEELFLPEEIAAEASEEVTEE